jgi:hypothetical protein
VRTRRFEQVLYLSLLVLAGCDPRMPGQPGLVTARELSGPYTGVLEGVSVANIAEVDDPNRHVIVDLDLLHELSIRETGPLTLRIQSSIIPPLRAFVVGVAPVAINAEFIAFEGRPIDGLKVKQVVFVQYQGEWIVVLQLIRVGVAEHQAVDSVYVYQFVSYPSALAERMSRNEAILYVNTILRLASAIQR